MRESFIFDTLGEIQAISVCEMMNKPVILLIVLIQLFLASCNAQIPGCTDPLANNYNPSATVNDGSCTYDPHAVSPNATYSLSEQLLETSGLVLWEDYIWTHNDNGDNRLYGLNRANGDISMEYLLEGVVNTDWEEVSQDEEYLYIGDIGNNASGNRTDLHLLRILKSSLLDNNPRIDTIWFTYSEQVHFDPSEPNQTDFDSEAFIVSKDSIYLFTKEWISAQTTVYSLPKIPGIHVADKITTFNAQGLITGASYLENNSLLVLCGYTSLLHPFLWLLYDFAGNNFFSGNKRRITVSLPFHQVEAIATNDGFMFYMSNEYFAIPGITNNPQKLHLLDLENLLVNYLLGNPIKESTRNFRKAFSITPNPACDKINLHHDHLLYGNVFRVFDQKGKRILQGTISSNPQRIDITGFTPGIYLCVVESTNDRMMFLKQ